MAVVIDGRLRQCDRPERVLSAPVDEEVASFVGTDTRLPGRVVSSLDGIALVEVGQGQIEAASTVGPGRAVLCCLRPEDVTLWSTGSPPPGPRSPGGLPHEAAAGAEDDRGVHLVSSARNQLAGHVRRIVPQGPLARVTVDCGVTLVAAITRASAADMGLVEGSRVVATFKASAVHLIPLAG
ncbi:MAG: TOBE domain-containing protein [Acidimicrobiales bacterium]